MPLPFDSWKVRHIYCVDSSVEIHVIIFENQLLSFFVLVILAIVDSSVLFYFILTLSNSTYIPSENLS